MWFHSDTSKCVSPAYMLFTHKGLIRGAATAQLWLESRLPNRRAVHIRIGDHAHYPSRKSVPLTK
jgi:hypothetical protein